MAAKSEALEEEAIIRKRFLIQTVGTSTTTIPPFKKLVKKYTQFCQSLQDGTTIEATKLHEELIADLYSVQAHIHRLHAIASAFHREQQLYQEKQDQLQSEITQAEKDIENRKLELEESRSELARQQEYEAVKRRVTQVPAKSATRAEVVAVEKEIADLIQQGNSLDIVMDRRKSQFASILQIIEQVHAGLGDDGTDLFTLDGAGTVGSGALASPEPMQVG